MKNSIAIFSSGSGSNAEELIRYFKKTKSAQVKFIITNNPLAGVINRAKQLGVSTFVFTKEELRNCENLLDFLQQNYIDFIVLAGYLLKIPPELVTSFPNAIVNIHPALLPRFGGKGMHGQHVHAEVLKAGMTESGITIHMVNELYDEGKIVFQEKCAVKPNDTPESLGKRVLALEHQFYPKIVERLLAE